MSVKFPHDFCMFMALLLQRSELVCGIVLGYAADVRCSFHSYVMTLYAFQKLTEGDLCFLRLGFKMVEVKDAARLCSGSPNETRQPMYPPPPA